MCVAESQPHSQRRAVWECGFASETQELNTGDTPDFQVLGNCFFFPQAGFAPDDQERDTEKATDRLGK